QGDSQSGQSVGGVTHDMWDNARSERVAWLTGSCLDGDAWVRGSGLAPPSDAPAARCLPPTRPSTRTSRPCRIAAPGGAGPDPSTPKSRCAAPRVRTTAQTRYDPGPPAALQRCAWRTRHGTLGAAAGDLRPPPAYHGSPAMAFEAPDPRPRAATPASRLQGPADALWPRSAAPHPPEISYAAATS